MSIDAYKAAQNATSNPRQVEYRIFAQVTNDLLLSIGSDFATMCQSVDRNRRLWLALQADLMSEANGLPDGLKAQLISMAIWVDKHSLRVLRGQGEIMPLIDVNRSIMEGLATQPAAAPAPAAGANVGVGATSA